MRFSAFHKLLCVIGILSVFLSSETGLAQSSERVTLSLKNASLQTVFSSIEAQTGYHFIYTNEQLKEAKPVTLVVNNVSIPLVLQQCFQDQPVNYNLEDKYIIVHSKESGVSETVIRGNITGDKGEVLVGATITIKGTSISAQTDSKGDFILTSGLTGTVLVVSYIGYTSQEIKPDKSGVVHVRLKLISGTLDDVQIIGYGTTTRRFTTGDIGTVKAETISQQPISNPLQALEGRVAGLFVNQSSGIPGSAISVQILGRNSIASGNDPYYIVDGVPFFSSVSPQVTSGNIALSPFNSINPADIESIDILKDADATSIYGSRGSNGVVLITTKKGKAGKTNLDINVNTGIGDIDRSIQWLNTPQYLQMRNEGFANDGSTPGPYDFDVNGTWDTTSYTNWQKFLIGGQSHATNAQVSLSGGSQGTQFLISGNYHRETTVFPGDFQDTRGGAHVSLTHSSPDKKFSFNFSGSFTVDQNELPSIDIGTYNYLSTPPDAPNVYDKDGKLNWDNGNWVNPLGWLENKYNTTTDFLLGNINLGYEIIPGLSLKAGLGYTSTWINNLVVYPSTDNYPGWGIQPYSQFGNSTLSTWNFEPQLSYSKTIGIGKWDFLIGGTIQQSNVNGYAVNATGFTSDELMESIANAGTLTVANNTSTEYKYAALFGRVNYQLLDRFIFNLTARRDGSSRFGPGKQYANFAAGGIAWIFSKEKFVENTLPGLSFGKIRVSYGTTGNDQIGDYQYLSTYSSTYNSFQGNVGLAPTRLANNDYSWEINRKFETGIDLGWLNDRVLFNLVYFLNRSSNQLLGTPLPNITGFNFVQANFPAVVQNKGFEIGINTVNIKSNNLSWRTSLNLTIPKNVLLSFPDISSSNYANIYEVGQPLSVSVTYKVAGVNTQNGIYQFNNLAQGGTTQNPSYPQDLVSIPVTQQYYWGLSNDITWKSWQLDIFFQYVRQQGINGLQPVYPYLVPGQMYNQSVSVLSRWQKPGDISPVQEFTAGYGDAYYAFTNAVPDLQIGDASFLRLKNVSISYSVKAEWLKKIHVSLCRLYIQGQNLFTISHFAGLDPENQYGTPPIRMVTGGFQFTL